VLIAAEEHTPKFRPEDPQLSELEFVFSGCYGVLQDLARLKEHFDSVGAPYTGFEFFEYEDVEVRRYDQKPLT
jgi:hypothetical protein